MTHQITLYEFQTKHGLGMRDIAELTGRELMEIKGYSTDGKPLPEELSTLIRFVDRMIDKLKQEKQVFTNNDAFHAANLLEKQNKKINELEKQLGNRITKDEEVLSAIDYFVTKKREGHLLASLDDSDKGYKLTYTGVQ
tara:strand:- start:275 stop:691 length:417 start_codon:yes stop_codon:yes gene_type:complete